MKKKAWLNYSKAGETFFLRRVFHDSFKHLECHEHDYFELMWVESSSCVHHINGREINLVPRTIILVRPNDKHRVEMSEGAVFSHLNFSSETFTYLKNRYFITDTDFWGGTGPLPLHKVLSEKQYEWLISEADKLARASRRNRLLIERFLINLLCELYGELCNEEMLLLPDWLFIACEKIRRPENFRKGVSQLAKLAGRSLKHTAKVLKQHTGKSPTQLVNEARLEYAASQLLMTSKEICDIAYQCGFASLSHFYKIFQSRYGMPPRRYRLKG